MRRQQASAGDIQHNDSRFGSLAGRAVKGDLPRGSARLAECADCAKCRREGNEPNDSVHWHHGWPSTSGCNRIRNTMPKIAKFLKPSSCPFQVRDCHIKTHPPPMVRKATSHIRREEVRASSERDFAALNARAGMRRACTNRSAPHESRIVVSASQTMMLR